MTEQFVKMGEAGEMSWLAVESAIQSLAPAFGEGLVAAGDMAGAFQQIVDSGGDGMDAIQGVKNAAIEAGEAGVTSFEAWKQALLDAGKDPQMVESFFQALSQRGITTLEQIKEATTRTIGGVIADMQTLSPVLSEQWVAAQEEAKKYIDTIASIPDESTKNVTINVNANISPDAREAMSLAGSTQGSGSITPMASGGIARKPILGMVGEAGPEAVLPLSRLPGLMRSMGDVGGNKSGTGTYYLDLRGAATGVESEVRRVIRELEGDIVIKAMNATSAQAQRGGSFGERFGQ
jgi:hypothetical protein